MREHNTGTYRSWIPVLSVELGFGIPWAVFQIPKPTILDSTNKIFRDSRFIIQNFHYMERTPDKDRPILQLAFYPTYM